MSSPPPRVSAPRRAALRAAFAWDTSTHPWLAGARCWWDGAVAARRSEPGPTRPGATASVAYSGLPEGRRHVLDFLEERGLRQLHGPSPAADIVLSGTTACQAVTPPGAIAALVLPFRVQLVVPVEDAGALRARISSRERRAFAANRRAHGWGWEQATDPCAFDHFYERMHLPTMRRRHGGATRSIPRDRAYECLFRRGRLFFITERGTSVAGVLCGWDAPRAALSMRMLGVLEGDERHYANGTVAALTHLTLEWASGHRVRELDLSGCEPFLSKGIFQFKQRFHPVVSLPLNHFGGKRLALRVVRDTPGVRDFLVANPVIAMARDGLEALYFHDDVRPARTELAWRCPGILRARDVNLDDFLARVASSGT